MNAPQFVKRFKEISADNGLEIEISDEEFAKLFISHMVVAEWQAEEAKKHERRAKEKSWRIDAYKPSTD